VMRLSERMGKRFLIAHLRESTPGKKVVHSEILFWCRWSLEGGFGVYEF
jgi:hypothetical protein